MVNKNEVFQLAKLAGQCGFDKFIIDTSVLYKEAKEFFRFGLPNFTYLSGYYDHMDRKAQQNGFYKHISEKYSLPESQVKRKFLSPSLVYCFLEDEEKADKGGS